MIALANRHPRVEILKPGPGVGGHCIAVDPWFIVDSTPQEARLIRMAREVNDGKTEYVLERAKALIDAHPDRPIACLGLAFKANVDDLRESPALEVAQGLAARYGERVGIVEPFVDELPDDLARHGARQIELEEALAENRTLILLVDHNAFRKLKREHLNGAPVYDTRGLWH